MGILSDIGVVSNGKLTKGTFATFINDVNRRLRTGKGILPTTVAKESDPVPYSYISKIEDSSIYPQFYQIWYARYDKMVKQLDVPGAFQLASKGSPIADPTALSVGLGASPPDVKFPDIVSEMQGLIPPASPAPIPPPTILDAMTLPSVKSLDYFNRYLKSLDPLDPSMLPKLTKLISMPAAAPVAQNPDPRLLQYGYVQQHYFEVALFKAHRTAQQSLMSLSSTSLPSIMGGIATGGGCDELLKFVYDVAAKSQPTPMSTSSFEIAAQEILLQHQVRYQAAAVLGQNIGSGAVVKSLAATLPADGGLGAVNSSVAAPSVTTGGGSKNSEASVGNGSELTDASGIGASSSASSNEGGDLFGFGAPPDDAAPPGTGASGGSAGQNFGFGAGMGDPSTPPDDLAPPIGKDQGGPSNTTDFGFGEPGPDLPPPQGAGTSLGGIEATSNYGFGPPPEDVPPGYVQGGQGGPSQFEQPPDDLPPPGIPGTGDATGLPGFGEAPPEVGDEGGSPAPPYTVTPGIDPTEQGVEVDYASFNPTKEEDEGPDPPVKAGMENTSTIANIPPGSNPNVDGDDDGDNDSPPAGVKGAKTKIRKRALKLLQAALGDLPPDYETKGGKNGQITTLVGIQGNVVDPRWGQVINSGGETFRGRIGTGFTTSDELKKHATNKATSCGALVGWLLDNLFFANGQPEIVFDIRQPLPSVTSPTSVAEWNLFVQNSGFKYWQNEGSLGGTTYAFSNKGFAAPGYVAAMLGAWVNADKTTGADTANLRLPKYGDVFLIRGSNGDCRHIGTFIEVNPQQGYCVTADSGQGSISAGSQGMLYRKRNWKTDSEGNIVMTGELNQPGNENDRRILVGYVDLDLLLAGLQRGYGYKSPFS